MFVEFNGARQNTRVLQWHHDILPSNRWGRWGRRRSTVRRELEGPAKLLAYRRSCVYSNVRCTRWKRLPNLRRRKAKDNCTSRGPNWVCSFSWWPRYINGLSKQHSAYHRLRIYWHLQPRNALGKGLGLLVKSKNDSERAKAGWRSRNRSEGL